MNKIEKLKAILTESFKEIINDNPEKIDQIIKEDFIRDFISSFLLQQKNSSVERELEKLKKTNPEYYKAIQDWNRRSEVLLKQMKVTFPKKSKSAGPFERLASKEWTDKSFWRMGGN